MRRIVAAILITLVLAGCGEAEKQHRDDSDAIARHPRYAKGFDILQHENFVEILLFNPWNCNEILTQYFLITDDSISTPDDGMRVTVPVRKVAITSVTQIEFLNMLGLLGTVEASCSPELIYNEDLHHSYETGKLTSIGDAFNLNTEQLMALKPDIVFATLYNSSSIQQQMTEANATHTVYDNEWTEASPLARAEWIKFMAAFYDRLDEADSIFAVIDSSYQQAKRLASSVNQKKSVMTGGNYRGTWYMPGGNSYMGTLLKDAHASYKYATDTTTGSLTLSFEKVLHEFAAVDVWLHAPAKTMGEIRSMDERHTLFAPFSSGEVYGFYKRLTATGANDFWESAVAHPDLILYDLIWALYPELLPEYEPTYLIKCGMSN